MLAAFGLVAAAAFLLGPALTWLRLVPAMTGFVLFAAGGLVSVVIAVLSIVRAARGRGLPAGGVAAIAAAAVFLVAAGRGAGGPRINDFTTDLADPPAFVHARTLPSNAGRDLGYPPRFAAIQQACCPDLEPAQLPVGSAEAFARARRVAAGMPGWQVTFADPTAGVIEAVATTPLFGFQDDIVIRVRSEAEAGSRVDMRSKSRDGQGDIGANAARIRAYVTALEGATGSPP